MSYIWVQFCIDLSRICNWSSLSFVQLKSVQFNWLSTDSNYQQPIQSNFWQVSNIVQTLYFTTDSSVSSTSRFQTSWLSHQVSQPVRHNWFTFWTKVSNQSVSLQFSLQIRFNTRVSSQYSPKIYTDQQFNWFHSSSVEVQVSWSVNCWISSIQSI